MKFVRTIYYSIHKIIFLIFVSLNPKIKTGHISKEHLDDLNLDKKILVDFQKIGVAIQNIVVSPLAYKDYISKTNYPNSYYGGGNDNSQNFIEKTLEHYVSFQFLNLKSDNVFIDIAACTSPFYQIVKKKYNLKNAYQQDLVFIKGLHGDKIGGYASEIPFEGQSVDAVTLHCSLEHFEGNSNVDFFKEMERILKPGGKIIVLPFYLAYEYTIHLDPAFNLLKFHKSKVDRKANIRYCDWRQYFSRHYDVKTLQTRVLEKVPDLELTIYQLSNYKDIHPSCYLRFIGVFTKK
ncbi:MAG: class I SAM-dependent methyltransferase [Bacteroidetes bacterium]|nr:class I SAM-dependent methyltransferase [Bacteroidota bacterium]MBT4729548.1 class I SAM-dependent methyltransferase [Bacteroidota bacterium]MBT7040007.1 class I SAM-dependent methyltransferase [Bacteroidota bacterium]